MPAPTTMSCRLTEGRELRGLSVAELAEQIGVTRQSIYNMKTALKLQVKKRLSAFKMRSTFPLLSSYTLPPFQIFRLVLFFSAT